jgi:hypothetical protein
MRIGIDTIKFLRQYRPAFDRGGTLTPSEHSHLLASYRQQHQQLLDSDPEFRQWLDIEYRPLTGGWQY